MDPSGTSVSSSSTPGAGAALSHNVISFSVAIKRCSEILLYKASLCVQELNGAQEAVTAELQRLSESSDACIAVSILGFLIYITPAQYFLIFQCVVIIQNFLFTPLT